MALIVAAALFIGIGWSLLNPFVGLLTLLAISIINPGELYPLIGALHVERIAAIVVFASFFFQGNHLTIPPISRKVLWFYVAILASVPFAIWKAGALNAAIEFARVVIYHLLIINLITSERRYRRFMIAYVALIGWMAFGTLFGYAHGQVDAAALRNGLLRATGLTSSGGNPNSLGLSLVAALPFVGLLLINASSTKVRALALIVGCMSISAIVRTGSRTSFLLLILLFVGFFLTRKRTVIYLPFLALALFGLWYVTPLQMKDRYLGVGDVMRDPTTDMSYLDRLYAWQAGRAMFADNPLTGVGVGQFPTANGMKYWPGPGPKIWLQPHNLFIQLIAELGLIGLVAWASFLFGMFKILRGLRARLSVTSDQPPEIYYFPTACLFSLCVLIIAGYSMHSLYRSNWYEMAALAGALSRLVTHSKVHNSVSSARMIVHEGATRQTPLEVTFG